MRADLKNKVKCGQVSFCEALHEAAGEDMLSHLRVLDLLKCVPRIGEKRAERIMERLDIAPNRRVRGLGRLQMEALCKEFGRR